MLRLQFILAWRNIIKRRFYSSIEIAGLAIGIACFLLMFLHVKKEFSYDKFFPDHEKIYRVLNFEKGTGNRYSGGASALGYHARTEIPQVEDVVRIFYPYLNYSQTALVRYDDVTFYEDKIIDADSNFFDFFDFKFVAGDADQALVHPNAVVINEEISKKYFGNTDAIGRLITIDGEALQVSGVVSVPENTHLNFDFVRPAHHDPEQLYVWIHTVAFTYVKVNNPKNVSAVQQQLYEIVMKYGMANDAVFLKNYLHQLQPLSEIHSTVLQWDIIQPTSANQLWAILIIAVFILILAIVNFINLATARSSERMKETGINKILGASRQKVTLQFFAEFFIMTLVAGAFSLMLLTLFIKPFNIVMNTSISIHALSDHKIQLTFILVLVVTSILAGLYPAYSMSTFKPSEAIRRSSTANTRQQRIREVLVVLQFVISFCLLSGTLIVQRQISFMQHADLGFDKNHIYILRLRDESHLRFRQLKEALKQDAHILKIAGASALLGGEPGSDTFHPDHMPDQTPETFSKNIAVDPEFLSLIDVPLLAGRNFDADNPQDYRTAYIINETAVKQFQLTDPVGINFRRSGERHGKVIGVMKDFHFAKMSDRINPMAFYLDSISSYRYMFIKLQGDVAAGVKTIGKSWSHLMPEFPMEGFFQDQYFNALYKQEQQIAKITAWFSVLAIGLASLGLLGMSSFVILLRTREIGIRKVVGASVADVLVLLSSNFIKLIAIAFVVSIPLTIYVLNQWLDGFASRISITIWFFIAAGIITIATALFTIGFQSIKAALANPVDALKQE